MRLYCDHTHYGKHAPENHPIEVTTGITLTVEDVNKAPRKWTERTYINIERWTELPRGGRFAAFKQPELLAEGIRAFLRPHCVNVPKRL
ncbi:hypothetical protein [Bacillus sp. 1P06AnD]|uniref:hypothetical protein n=1 Tax=Bacillus sp. 1P06AnD TaxID=3132208 RepID=UPI00399F4810